MLACEALRNAKLLREVFPGGVYWVDMGEGNTMQWSTDMDKSELLVKIQNLILRLDKARYQPPNLAAAQSYLQKVIEEQHPKCLLVLDNLWRADVAKYFSVRCRVLATTRNATVAQSVSTPSIASLDVSNMFTEEQLRLLLAKWVQKSPDELPVHADIVVQLSNGSPLVISIIGALLRTNPTDARWAQCIEKLQSRRLSISLRRPPQGWQYRNMTLLNSIELGISALDQELQEYFYHLVVLDNNVAITSEALAVMWDTDEMDAEAIMLRTYVELRCTVLCCTQAASVNALFVCSVRACVCVCVCLYGCVCILGQEGEVPQRCLPHILLKFRFLTISVFCSQLFG